MATILFKTLFGSHMYGLNTPSSDLDYKSVSLPSLHEVLLRGPVTHKVSSTGKDNQKNTSEDVDNEDMSLVKFVQLATRGEMLAMDMLHSPLLCWEWTSPQWEHLVKNRSLFYTNQVDAYLGYLRRQTPKYGLKGSRLYALQEAIKFLEGDSVLAAIEAREGPGVSVRVGDVSDLLFVDGEYARMSVHIDKTGRHWNYYEVLGSKYQYEDHVSRVLESLKKKMETYGDRALAAAKNEGIDWKAVHHATRAAYQLVDLYTKGEMILPFTGTQRNKLIAIKKGELTWDHCSGHLSELSDKVVQLAATSEFPSSVNREAVETLVLECYGMAGMYP